MAKAPKIWTTGIAMKEVLEVGSRQILGYTNFRNTEAWGMVYDEDQNCIGQYRDGRFVADLSHHKAAHNGKSIILNP